MINDCTGIIDALIKRRQAIGLTQKELAEKTRLKQPAIARFEQKKVVPRYDMVVKIARALGCRLTISAE